MMNLTSFSSLPPFLAKQASGHTLPCLIKYSVRWEKRRGKRGQRKEEMREREENGSQSACIPGKKVCVRASEEQRHNLVTSEGHQHPEAGERKEKKIKDDPAAVKFRSDKKQIPQLKTPFFPLSSFPANFVDLLFIDSGKNVFQSQEKSPFLLTIVSGESDQRWKRRRGGR